MLAHSLISSDKTKLIKTLNGTTDPVKVGDYSKMPHLSCLEIRYCVLPIVIICVLKQSFLFLQVWQHCDCMRLETEVEHYLCEQCDLRPVDRVCVLYTFAQNGSPCRV